MGSARRSQAAITIALSTAFGVVVLLLTVPALRADPPERTVSSPAEGAVQVSGSNGPVSRVLPDMLFPFERQGVDAETAWSASPSSGIRGTGSSLLHDNGQHLNDSGSPPSQLSIDDDGRDGFFAFSAAGADDFVLEDFFSPQTNARITMIRAAFAFFEAGAETATPRTTWTQGLDVVVYANAPLFDTPAGEPNGDGTFSNFIQAQHVDATSIGETLVDDGCIRLFVVDIPVDFVLAKNTRYWLSLVPRHPFPPESFWCLSQNTSTENRSLEAQWGASFSPAFWTTIGGNLGDIQCLDAPLAGTHRDFSFQIFGGDLGLDMIACCDETAGTCTDILAPANCLPNEVAYPGAMCGFVPCEILIGACCDDTISSCNDNALAADCVGPNDRFTPILSCSGVDSVFPPCGTTELGACCFQGQTCMDLTPTDCSQSGGNWDFGNCGSFDCPPDNDICDNALLITNDGAFLFDTTGAATDGPPTQGDPACTDVNQDIWFRYFATCDGILSVDLCNGTTFDSALEIYDGCFCDGGLAPLLACDNDFCAPAGASAAAVPVRFGLCYLIRVGGAGTATGQGVLTLSCAPDVTCCLGDMDASQVRDLSDVPLMVNALLSPPLPLTAEFCAADVNEDHSIDGLDIAPFVDFLLNPLPCVPPPTGACCLNDGSCTPQQTENDCLASGGVFQGADTLCTPNPCPQPPPNDECVNAIALTCNAPFTFNNILATTSLDDPEFSCLFGGPGQGAGSVWFTFVATDTDALLTTCGTFPPVTDVDTLIAVYDGACPVVSGQEIACAEDAGGSCGRLSQVCVEGLVPGNTYVVQVASFDEQSKGLITFEITCPCPRGACCFGDDSCQELPIDQCLGAGGDFLGDGIACDPNPCLPVPRIECCLGDMNVDGSIDTLDVPSLVAALLNPPAPNTPEFCRADVNADLSVDGEDVIAFVPLVLGQEVCAPISNDDCSNALFISCDAFLAIDNTLATTDPSDPVYSCRAGPADQGVGTLWYVFVATDTSAFVSTCGSFLPANDTLLAVYDAPCPTAGNEIACSEDPGGACGRLAELCVQGLTPGQAYYLQVSSFDDETRGPIAVEIACPCP